MGTTFPLGMQFIREKRAAEKESFSFLYLANVLGACTGTLATAYILVEWLGFNDTLKTASVVNFTVGAGALIWALVLPTPPRRLPQSGNSQALPKNSIRAWYPALLFSTGFTSMAMEVAWVRDYTPILGNEVYAFSGLLAVYLFATWMGSWLYRRQTVFQKVVSIETLLALLSSFAFLPVALNDPRWHHTPWVALLSLVPFCGTLGYLTPCLIDRLSKGDARIAGRGYAFNILGCILGPLLASYLLLPFLGSRWSLVVLALPFLFFYLVLAGKFSGVSFRPSLLFPAFGLFIFSGFFCGSYEEGTDLSGMKQMVLRRDATATVISYQGSSQKALLVNGIGMTAMTPIPKIMAHLPMLFCPHSPRSALVICFGMGTTFRSIASWGVDTTAVELVPSVRDAFGYYFTDAQAILNNPKNRVVIDDGRRFLSRTRRKFDVITLDPPPPPEAAGSSLLYTGEFYAALKNHLQEGGVVQQWINWGNAKSMQAFIRSFTRSFPYVRAFVSLHGGGLHMIGSLQPLTFPPILKALSLMPALARKDFVEWNLTNKDPAWFLNLILSSEADLNSMLNPDEQITVTDDRPFNEYYLLRRAFPTVFRY